MKKLQSPYIGPYLVVNKPSEVTYATIQGDLLQEPGTVLVDHLKEYYGLNVLKSWLQANDTNWTSVVQDAPPTLVVSMSSSVLHCADVGYQCTRLILSLVEIWK